MATDQHGEQAINRDAKTSGGIKYFASYPNAILTQQSSSSVKKIFLKCWATVRHHGNLDSQGCEPPAAQLIKAVTAYVPSNQIKSNQIYFLKVKLYKVNRLHKTTKRLYTERRKKITFQMLHNRKFQNFMSRSRAYN